MAIDFTLAPEHEEIRSRVRTFIQETVQPRIKGFDDESRVASRHEYLVTILELREQAKKEGLWLPHMPKSGVVWDLVTWSWPWCRRKPARRGSGHGS